MIKPSVSSEKKTSFLFYYFWICTKLLSFWTNEWKVHTFFKASSTEKCSFNRCITGRHARSTCCVCVPPPCARAAFPTQQEQTVTRATYWIGSHPALTYTLNLYVTDGGISLVDIGNPLRSIDLAKISTGSEGPQRPGRERSCRILILPLMAKMLSNVNLYVTILQVWTSLKKNAPFSLAAKFKTGICFSPKP